MPDILWGLWVRLRVVAAKGQWWVFTAGKWLAVGFLAIYVGGIMVALTLIALGFEGIGHAILDSLWGVDQAIKGIVAEGGR